MSGFITGIGPAFKGVLALLNIREKFVKRKGIKKDADIDDTYLDTLNDLDDILPK